MSVRARLGVLVRCFPKLSETFILEEILGLERRVRADDLLTLRPPSDVLVQPAVAQVRAPIVPLYDAMPASAPGGEARRESAGEYAGVEAEVPRPDARPSDAQLAQLLSARLRDAGIAHLHAHFIDGPAAIAARAAQLAGIGFSISAHARDIYLGDPEAIRQRLGEACFTVTCTTYNHAVLERLAPPGAAVHCVYHGIDTGRFAPRPRARAAGAPPTILAVGRLRAKKGFATLVRACGLLRAQGVAFACEIVGYGEEQAALEALVEAEGLQGVVRLRGKMNHSGILGLYREATVFAAPSEVAADGDRDGIPNVLLEAMACALPVISTPSPASRGVFATTTTAGWCRPPDARWCWRPR